MDELQLIEQIEDGASQTGPGIIEVAGEDKRIAPIAGEGIRVTMTGPEIVIGQPGSTAAAPELVGFPVLRWTRYASGDIQWRELLSWQIPDGYVGDLHEISVQSDNDAKTRYRITIAEIDMQIPIDRELSTPADLPWRDVKIPGPATVMVEVRSTDGTTITVDGLITGTIRTS
jgi:hypothetical protein